MTVVQSGASARLNVLGSAPVSKATGTLAATTVPLFTIAGGEVLITAMWGKVTTAITVANSYKLQTNPTTGDTADLTTATDIGTTDTAAGTILGVLDQTDTPPDLNRGGKALAGVVVSTGQIEHVSAGTDGAITWYVTWVPLTDGATLVAA
jgi:hypothetical protein